MMFAHTPSDMFQQDKASKAPLRCLSMFLEHIALTYAEIINKQHLKTNHHGKEPASYFWMSTALIRIDWFLFILWVF